MRAWQIRRLKALGLALVFVPVEYIYVYSFPYGPGEIVGFLVILGTILFLLGYAMEVPYEMESPPDETLGRAAETNTTES